MGVQAYAVLERDLHGELVEEGMALLMPVRRLVQREEEALRPEVVALAGLLHALAPDEPLAMDTMDTRNFANKN